MSTQDASADAATAANATSPGPSVLQKSVGSRLINIFGALFLIFIVGKCTMIKIDEWNMSPTESAAYQAKIQARWDAEEAQKKSKVSGATRQSTPVDRLAQYRAFVDHMSAHQSFQCRKIVAGSTGTLLQLATEVSEDSELLYKSNLKWAKDGACV